MQGIQCLTVRPAIIIGAITCLCGCALETASQKAEYTSFQPTAEGFTYKGHAYGLQPIDSAEGERWRMEILESYLRDNQICPAGYDITSRKPILVNRSSFGDNYTVWYTGRCK